MSQFAKEGDDEDMTEKKMPMVDDEEMQPYPKELKD